MTGAVTAGALAGAEAPAEPNPLRAEPEAPPPICSDLFTFTVDCSAV